jgi:hypothetical protein
MSSGPGFKTSALRLLASLGLSAALLLGFPKLSQIAHAQQEGTQTPAQTAGQSSTQGGAATSALPRGKKLMLKDGSFQLVREYKLEGDRVRYYSMDRSQWEEIPASVVDWDATKRVETEESQHDAAFVAKVHEQEQARRATTMDIDASLELAPGTFLPPGEGMFVFDNKAVLQVPAADPVYKTDKKRQIEQVLSPVPVVASRYFVLITGAHAKLRVRSGQPEFYLRTTAGSEPDIQLVSVKVQGTTRQVGNVSELFKQQRTNMHTLLLQRWQIAQGVYRYTLGQSLSPGEYALVQVIEAKTELEQLNMNVWDFAVDPAPQSARTK